jgi:hypothetical protein
MRRSMQGPVSRWGYAVAQLVEALRFKPEDWFQFLLGSFGFSSGHTVALGLTQPVTEVCVRDVSWGLRQLLHRADTLLPSCVNCLEAAMRSYPGLYRECFY